MSTSNSILTILRQHKNELQQRYAFSQMGLFGSYARDTQHANSDVDILVDFENAVGLNFIKLAQELEDLLGKKIDLVHKKAVKPNRLPYVEKDIIYV